MVCARSVRIASSGVPMIELVKFCAGVLAVWIVFCLIRDTIIVYAKARSNISITINPGKGWDKVIERVGDEVHERIPRSGRDKTR